MRYLLKDILIPQPKSKIKAGEGKKEGEYKFFTSSIEQTKFIDIYNYDKEALIFGTGGNANVHYCDTLFSTSTDCIVMYTEKDIELKLIYYYLKNNIHLLEDGFKGAGIKHISKDYILNLSIDLPLKCEQKNILKVIENAENIILNRKQQLSKLDELVKSRFIEMFGDPIHPTHSKPLGDVAVLERGRFSPRPRNDPRYYGGDYPFIQTGDIANCGHRLFTYRQTLNEMGVQVSKKFPVGTIVIAIVGATIGATAILEIEVYAPDSVIGISVDTEQYNAIFMETLLRFWQPELLRIAPESARANINLGILQNIPIIDTNLQLQEQFAAFVKQIDKSKLAIQQSLEQLETLKKSLMQQYFG